MNGGHIIMLNARDSKYYEEDKVQALKALKAFEGGLQIGGGITDLKTPFKCFQRL